MGAGLTAEAAHDDHGTSIHSPSTRRAIAVRRPVAVPLPLLGAWKQDSPGSHTDHLVGFSAGASMLVHPVETDPKHGRRLPRDLSRQRHSTEPAPDRPLEDAASHCEVVR